jgi:hypothetical protein
MMPKFIILRICKAKARSEGHETIVDAGSSGVHRLSVFSCRVLNIDELNVGVPEASRNGDFFGIFLGEVFLMHSACIFICCCVYSLHWDMEDRLAWKWLGMEWN